MASASVYSVFEDRNYENVRYNAGSKARLDINDIFNLCGMDAVPLELDLSSRDKQTRISKVAFHLQIEREWKKVFNIVSPGIVFIQFPAIGHSIFLPNVIAKYKKHGLKVVLLVHDIELLRAKEVDDISLFTKMRINLEENRTLKIADCIIAHNEKMIDELLAITGMNRDKFVSLQIFDYLLNCDTPKCPSSIDKPVVIAGNLSSSKSGYLRSLPSGINFNLYGAGYDSADCINISYKGKFNPNILPSVLDGSFGLIWDGPSPETCVGAFGSYLKINNPHKASLYLASGLPLIVWSKSAIADFVTNNECGLLIDNLNELEETISSIDKQTYEKILANTYKLSNRIRTGFYTERAIKESLKIVAGNSLRTVE